MPKNYAQPHAFVDSQKIGDIVAKAPTRSKKTSARRPWSKEDVKTLKGMARKEPLRKSRSRSSAPKARPVRRRPLLAFR